jgi:hypothetical protein
LSDELDLRASDAERERFAISIFGGVERKGRWRVPRRSFVLSLLGGADLDLRQAEIAADVVTPPASRSSVGSTSTARTRRRDPGLHSSARAAWRCSAARTSGACRRARRRSRSGARAAKVSGVEGGFGFPLGGDPEELMRGLREFAEQQAESVQEAQREQFATLTLNTAVELTAAALGQVRVDGGSDEQAIALRDAMRVLFPEAVALVSAARQGFMREHP